MFSLIFGILVVSMVVFTIVRNFHFDHPEEEDDGPSTQQLHKKYTDALEVAMHFFDIQKCAYVRTCTLT